MNITSIKKIKKTFQPPWRVLLFKIVRRIVLKYFKEDVIKIEGKNSTKGKTTVAWQWSFADENYEKTKSLK